MCTNNQSEPLAPLTRDQAYNLFKMYEDKGWEVKKQVTTFVMWLMPVTFALIGLSYDEHCTSDALKSNILGLTAFAVSVFMASIVFGSLRHADRDYAKADEIMSQSNKLFPDNISETIQHKPSLITSSIKLNRFLKPGMPRIGGVHIFLMWLAFLLVPCSLAFWTWSFLFPCAPKITPSESRQSTDLLPPIMGGMCSRASGLGNTMVWRVLT